MDRCRWIKWIWIIFADIIGRGREDNRIKLFTMWEGEELTLCTDQVKIGMFKSKDNGRSDLKYPKSFDLKVSTGNYQILADFTTEKFLDVIDFVQPRCNSKYLKQLIEMFCFLSEKVPGLVQILKKIINYNTYIRLNTKCEFSIKKGKMDNKKYENALCEIMDFGEDH